jgi:hypothetical protein
MFGTGRATRRMPGPDSVWPRLGLARTRPRLSRSLQGVSGAGVSDEVQIVVPRVMTGPLLHEDRWPRLRVLRRKSADHGGKRHKRRHRSRHIPFFAPRLRRIIVPVMVAVLCAASAYALLPRAGESYRLLNAEDDPAALADIFLARAFNPQVARIEIENALDADDAELAASFMELARDRGVGVDPGLAKRVEDANSTSAQAGRAAKSYVRGIRTGAPDDLAGFAGAMTRDLSGYGDVSDAVTEGTHLAKGESADELVFGLACVGLVATAATFVTVGAAAPVRAGLSIVKAARRTGRLAGPLAQWAKRIVRGAIDTEKLEIAMSKVSITAPAESATIVSDAVKEAVDLERLEGITAMMGDVGRIQAKGGTRAALEGLRLSESPQEVARVARLAEKEGTKTSAILKLAGRSAFVLTAAVLDLVGWVFSALWLIIGFLIAIKSTTERTTERYLRWRKKRRRARAEALAATAAKVTAP